MDDGAGAEQGRRTAQLTHDECWLALSSQQVGRLGVVAGHYPLIFPVNFGLVEGVIVIATRPGTKLQAAAHANVTFEVDQIEPLTRTGWSVLVRGLAEELAEGQPAEVAERTKASGVQAWEPGEHASWLRIIPHSVTGRRILPGEQLPAFSDAAYL